MSRGGPAQAIRGFGAFWWDFIVGDDWRIAAGVIVALAATAGLVHAGVPAWWLLPVAALGMLAVSLWSARRASTGPSSAGSSSAGSSTGLS